MTMEALEAEVRRLQEREKEWDHIKDMREIEKLSSMYSHLFAGRSKDVPHLLFAMDSPGLEVEISDMGVYEGPEGINKVFVDYWGSLQDGPGRLGLRYLVNPIIEINKDGTRAKGIWQSPGVFTADQDGKMASYWEMGKYDIEYVKEHGKWKFLKFAWRMIFLCRFNGGPAEDRPLSTDFLPGFKPDRPCTYHMPYMPTRINRWEEPKMPQPYED